MVVGEGRAGKTPLGELEPMIGEEIPFPENLSCFEIETERVPFRAQSVDGAFVKRRRSTRSSLIVKRVQLTVVGVFPQHLSGLGIETPDRISILLVPHRENAISRHRNSAESDSHFGGPRHRQVFRKGFRNQFG